MRSFVALSLSTLMLWAMMPLMQAQAQEHYLEPGSQMLISLNTRLDSHYNRSGDAFRATVEEPERLQGDTVYGHVADIEPSGRFRGRTEMSLAFDSVRYPDGDIVPFNASVVDVRQSESVKMVEENGDIVSGSRSGETIKRGSIGAAIGGVLGAIIGGGRGLAIGLVSGGAAGAGSLLFDNRKELRLEPGTEMDIEALSVSYGHNRYEGYNNRRMIMNAQQRLSDQGYYNGEIDGTLNPGTRRAIAQFQRDNYLAATGTLNRETADQLGLSMTHSES